MATVELQAVRADATGPLGVRLGNIQLSSSYGVSASALAVGDFTSNGYPDIAVLQNSAVLSLGLVDSTQVTILTGNGDGTFAIGATYPIPWLANDLVVADISADGQPDILVTNSTGNNVEVLLGNGNGTFAIGPTYGVGNLPTDVAIADFTGNGAPDMAVVNFGDGTVSVLLHDTISGTVAVPVVAVSATRFVFGANPISIIAGNAVNFTLIAEDQNGYTVINYTGTVHFASSDRQASLPADATLTNGVGSFSATLKTAGIQLLTATDTLNKTIIGTSAAIAVSPTAATHLAVTAPGVVTAGTPQTFTVTALDQFNNQAITYAGIVHFTSTDSAASLPADSALAFGLGTFSVTLNMPGTQTLTATDTTTTAIAGTSNTISVSPVIGAAAHFSVSGPSSTTAGNAFVLTVKALDSAGNTASGYAGTVQFSSSDSQVGLPANGTLASGIGYFAAVLKTAGNQALTVTDTVNNAIAGTSAAITTSALRPPAILCSPYLPLRRWARP